MIYFINIVYSHLTNILKMLKMSFVERCNKNLTLDVIFLQVDPSAEIFADQIRGDVKLYGTEQSYETIESLVSAGDLYIFVGQYAVCVSQIIYHFEIMNIFFFLLLKLLHIEIFTDDNTTEVNGTINGKVNKYILVFTLG